MYAYSINDLTTARYILKNQGKDRNGLDLYPSTFITWSKKVVNWFSMFYQVLRRYARVMKAASLAIKAIWQNIRAGISLPRMIRLYTAQIDRAHKAWKKNEHTERGQAPARSIPATHSMKTERRAAVIRQTNSLQSFTI